ncbi:MAG: adenylyl-sulfate kinase [Pirellulaceae bacterium]|jgi:adenylylsulfate kinase|nr:adenylyl-sulfate kinase [Pirellulaceae bacterium]MDP7020141.1 adenylyl-sulfate kinase [Pirellulaceae bacterium]
MTDQTQVTWHDHSVTREQREQQNGHRGCVVWFTGLSGCGKSTVANAVDIGLHKLGARTYLLDGDNVRHGLNAAPHMLAGQHGDEFAERFGLGFSDEDRVENIRRIGAVAELFAQAGVIALTAFVSPFQSDRDAVRQRLDDARPGDFFEVFVDTPLEICEQRDPKGLYKQARRGEIKNFTGVDSPYERPTNPELVLQGGELTPDVLADRVIELLREREALRL